LRDKLIIWGASGHAKVIADIVKLEDRFELVGFLDNINKNTQGRLLCGLPIYGGEEQLDNLKQNGVKHLILGFGNCEARLALSSLIINMGFSLATAIHPKSILAHDIIVGNGVVIAAGAVINPGAQIGDNAIINTASVIEHGCSIQEGAHICPGTCLGGDVIVGRASWIGIGSVVKDHVQIGAGVCIGAGSVVINDIPDEVVAYGVPAKIVRSNKRDDKTFNF